MHKKPWVQAILDTGFGALGMKVFVMAGGSVISMIAMITFTACAMFYIFSHITINKMEDVYHGYVEKLRL